ncbi:YxeA family protein [Listeria welshimeri]|uniref:YxeA family protein n=1 Tax=Listeria welshimeri TaxID=1643 RepID=UPI00162905DE|nr:YxeA family protein [Listeria welshimeri]MBC1447222.1 YxeA family protein [Listeria welshimeri]MBC1608771.1 YxeA family protein [Listeria welshimeri]MBC1626780.1 YxeA family protein [Listeria welshimeri]MBC1697153.1 YxeA family protein [Listeria welshimeri]MBF2611976.1 YxeA family protein [Listeria welshimeri]
MKKIIIIITSIILLGGIAFGAYYLKNGKKMGSEQLYVKITKDGVQGKDVGFNYSYTLPAYNEDGKEKEVTFTADKNLRKGAYLKLYYKKSKGVTTFEEVSSKNVPAKAAEKLN